MGDGPVGAGNARKGRGLAAIPGGSIGPFDRSPSRAADRLPPSLHRIDGRAVPARAPTVRVTAFGGGRSSHIPIMVGGGGEKRTLRTLAKDGDIMNVGGTPRSSQAKIDVLNRALVAAVPTASVVVPAPSAEEDDGENDDDQQ